MASTLLILIYIAFISLGLPDALLGSAWPIMQPDLSVPYSFAGILQLLIAGGTIVSSLLSGWLIRRMGTARLTSISVACTAAALLCFGWSASFIWLIVAAIPLGLGAGAVDSGLNAYVARHYQAHHMSWLHSFWGVGALSGPLVLSALLGQGISWRSAYLSLGIFQSILFLVLLASIPLWNKRDSSGHSGTESEDLKHIGLFRALKQPGVGSAMLVFLFYCGIEASMGLWGSSFLFISKGMAATKAAVWVSFFFGSITLGRFLNGFLTFRFSNQVIIRSGIVMVCAGVAIMLLPLPLPLNLLGFLLTGFGCAPIFPSMIHETPSHFGANRAQSIIGFQMASAYVGTTFLPPLFGFIAGTKRMQLLPLFLLLYAAMMLLNFMRLRAVTNNSAFIKRQ